MGSSRASVPPPGRRKPPEQRRRCWRFRDERLPRATSIGLPTSRWQSAKLGSERREPRFDRMISSIRLHRDLLESPVAVGSFVVTDMAALGQV